MLFSPSGEYIVSRGYDNHIRVWHNLTDLPDGSFLACCRSLVGYTTSSFVQHNILVLSASFGRRFVLLLLDRDELVPVTATDSVFKALDGSVYLVAADGHDAITLEIPWLPFSLYHGGAR